MFDLSGRRALVTGAGRNIGAGIAAALADRGAEVVVNDLVAERADAAASAIDAGGSGRATAAPFDVTDLDAATAAVARFGPFDIVVNNAGLPGDMEVVQFRDLDPARWDRTVRLNVYGAMNVTKAVIDHMCDQGWGRVITIASGAGTAGTRIGVAPYSAGKGGAIAFTRTLALEVARSGVTANSLALGVMTTGDDGIDERLARSVPVGRPGTPDDIGAACVWLASDEAAWVTGQTIEINGGSITT